MRITTLPFAATVVALCLFAGSARADIAAGLQAHAAGNWAQAVSEFQADVSADATRFEANWRTGVTYFISGDSKKALKHLKKAVAENGEHAPSQFWIARAYGDLADQANMFSAVGYAKASKRAFEKAVALAPDDLAFRSGLMLFHLKAPAIVGGSIARAIEQAQAIKTRDAERGYISLAIIHRVTGNSNEEIAVYDAMLAEFPQNAAGRLQRGDLHRQAGNFEAAYRDFLAVATSEAEPRDADFSANFSVSLEPRLMATYLLGAVASSGKIHIQEGITALQRFLATGIVDKPLRTTYGQYHLASLYFSGGDSVKAWKLLQIALAGPSDKILSKLMKKLKKSIKNNN